MSEPTKARVMEDLLFECVAAVAEAHSIVLPARGTSYDVEAAFAALTEKPNRHYVMVSASRDPEHPRVTISSSWEGKRSLVQEVVDLINDDHLPVCALFEAGKPEVVVYHLEVPES